METKSQEKGVDHCQALYGKSDQKRDIRQAHLNRDGQSFKGLLEKLNSKHEGDVEVCEIYHRISMVVKTFFATSEW